MPTETTPPSALTTTSQQSVARLLDAAYRSGVDRLEAQRLLLYALGRPTNDRAWLLAHDTDTVTIGTKAQFMSLCTQRLDDVPLAYLLGQRGFYGLELKVDSRVLDPRPDTETLVDWALELLPTLTQQSASVPRVLDLGTGSGAIALAIKHQHPQSEVWAVDSSTNALDVAKVNANHLNLDIHFCVSNWFDAIATDDKWNLIVSNPPYIADQDHHLHKLRHEPISALTSGSDGLTDLRLIIEQAPNYMTTNSWVLLEHGYDQAEIVTHLLENRGFMQVQSRHDLAGIARCTGGLWRNPRKEG